MNFIYILDLIGTAAFAASGAWAGIRRDMDLLGVLVLGLVTATGGGTLRDILLGDLPPFSLQDETYLYLSLTISLLIFLFHRRLDFLRHPLLYFDAIGLGTFVVIGTGKALDFNIGFVGAIMMGVMTATAGGMLRDVLSNEVPLVLRREVYASACIVGAALLTALHHLDSPRSLSAFAAAVTVIGIRLAAIHFNWSLPRAQS